MKKATTNQITLGYIKRNAMASKKEKQKCEGEKKEMK